MSLYIFININIHLKNIYQKKQCMTYFSHHRKKKYVFDYHYWSPLTKLCHQMPLSLLMIPYPMLHFYQYKICQHEKVVFALWAQCLFYEAVTLLQLWQLQGRRPAWLKIVLLLIVLQAVKWLHTHHTAHCSLQLPAVKPTGCLLNSSPSAGGVQLDSSGSLSIYTFFFFFKGGRGAGKLLTLDLECVGVLGQVQSRVPRAV